MSKLLKLFANTTLARWQLKLLMTGPIGTNTPSDTYVPNSMEGAVYEILSSKQAYSFNKFCVPKTGLQWSQRYSKTDLIPQELLKKRSSLSKVKVNGSSLSKSS